MSFSLVKDAKSSTIFVCSLVTGKRAGISSVDHLTLLRRFKANNANDPMLVGELDIVRTYSSRIYP